MTPSSPRTLVLLGLLAMAGGLLVRLPAVPWTVVLVEVLAVAAVLASAWPVRRWVRGDAVRRVEPLQAARTAVLAKASSLAGSILAGWWLSQVLLAAPRAEVEPVRDRLVIAALAGAAALGMVAAGLVAERWCRVPPREDDEDQGREPLR